MSAPSSPAATAATAAVSAVQILAAMAEAIRQVGSIPSGHLYAQMIGVMSMSDYEAAVGLLKRAGLVEETANVLRWIGPKVST